jgi:hypothetical protein
MTNEVGKGEEVYEEVKEEGNHRQRNKIFNLIERSEREER